MHTKYENIYIIEETTWPESIYLEKCFVNQEMFFAKKKKDSILQKKEFMEGPKRSHRFWGERMEKQIDAEMRQSGREFGKIRI